MSLIGLMGHRFFPTVAVLKQLLIIMAQITLHTMDQSGVGEKRLDGIRLPLRPRVTVFKSL